MAQVYEDQKAMDRSFGYRPSGIWFVVDLVGLRRLLRRLTRKKPVKTKTTDLRKQADK